jgi:Co/Zn/Cd efflux system component
MKRIQYSVALFMAYGIFVAVNYIYVGKILAVLVWLIAGACAYMLSLPKQVNYRLALVSSLAGLASYIFLLGYLKAEHDMKKAQ